MSVVYAEEIDIQTVLDILLLQLRKLFFGDYMDKQEHLEEADAVPSMRAYDEVRRKEKRPQII